MRATFSTKYCSKIASRSMQNRVSVDSAFPSKFRSFLDDARRRKTDHGISMAVFSQEARWHALHRHKAISLGTSLYSENTHQIIGAE